jgi:hypothetical protein
MVVQMVYWMVAVMVGTWVEQRVVSMVDKKAS